MLGQREAELWAPIAVVILVAGANLAAAAESIEQLNLPLAEAVRTVFAEPPSSQPSYAAGYDTDPSTGQTTYREGGVFAGKPSCGGTWAGPTTTLVPTTSSHRRLSFGFNTTSGFIVVERSTSANIITHDEWQCTQGAGATDFPNCENDLRNVPFLPAATPSFVPRAVPPGWSTISNVVNDTAALAVEQHQQNVDSRVLTMRGNFELSGIPFTGRVVWSFDDPALDGLRTQSFLLGRCLGEFGGGSQIGEGYGYAGRSDLPIALGAAETSGVYPGLPAFPRFSPVGNWTAWVEGCNAICT